MSILQIIGYLGAISLFLSLISFIIPTGIIKTSTKIFILIIAALVTIIAIREDAFSNKSPNIDISTNQSAPLSPTPTPMSTLMSTPTSTPMSTPTSTPTQQIESSQPQINASADNGKSYSEEGDYLNDDLGERMTFTCRKVLVPEKSWDEELSKSELKTIASRWVDVIITLPEKMDAVIFGGGIKQNGKSYTEGILVKVNEPGTYSFRILNGEIVIWYQNQDEYEGDDFLRIINQVSYGNSDTNRKLKLQAISSNLLPSIPDNYINKSTLKKIEIPVAN